MLARFQTGIARGAFAEAQESPNLVPELG